MFLIKSPIIDSIREFNLLQVHWFKIWKETFKKQKENLLKFFVAIKMQIF